MSVDSGATSNALSADNGGDAVRPPLSDSPWFWAYVFATGAVVSLLLAQPRYGDRQSQLERQFTARQTSGQVVVGDHGPIPPSTPERMVLPLRPLLVVCCLTMVLGWGGLCWHRFSRRPRSRPLANPSDSTP